MENKLFTDPPKAYTMGSQMAAVRDANAQRLVGQVGRVVTVAVTNQENGSGKNVEIMQWGADNMLPFERERVVGANNILPQMLRRSRDICLGQGIFSFQKKYIDDTSGQMREDKDEVPMPPDAAAFFERFSEDMITVMGDLHKHSIAIVEFVVNGRGEVVEHQAIEVKYCRAEKKDRRGKINAWWYSNNWDRSMKPDEAYYERLPVYDGSGKQRKFIVVLQDNMLNDGYYPMPPYWGGRSWIDLANSIPAFHQANVKNGAAPRFHVEVAADYFLNLEEYEAANSDEDRARVITSATEAEQTFLDALEGTLTGTEGAGRMVVTKRTEAARMGGEPKTITINGIEYNLHDNAMLDLYKASNVANVSALGLHPVLASIDAGKGIGSGTEIRNAYLMHLITAAPRYRDLVAKLWNLIKRTNNWDPLIHYGFKDAAMTTLSDDPTGMTTQEPV